MKDKFRLLRRQVIYDLKNGILLQYKKIITFLLLIIILFLFFNNKVYSYKEISHNSVIGFWDYLIYIFRGKEVIRGLSQLDMFDIPVEWILIHGYLLLVIATYPKNDYIERGYQLLIRVGSKWQWWLSKGIYILVSACVYHLCILIVAVAFTAVQGGSFYQANYEIAYHVARLDLTNFIKSEMVVGTLIIPVIIFTTLCFMGMLISFLFNNLIAVIAMIAYLSRSAYWCNKWLLGNYSMLLRADKLSYIEGIGISCASIILSFILGYFYFKRQDIIGKKGDL